MTVEMKDSGIDWIGEIPKHWEVTKLKRLLQINNGADYKAVESDSGIPVIGSGGQFAWAKRYMYDGEVVLLGRKGTIDKPLYYKGKFWAVDTMFYSIPTDRTIGKFAYYISICLPFKVYSTSTALPSMTQTILGNMNVVLPSKEEQSRIANFLDKKCAEIDELIALQEQMIAQLTTYKQAVITETVTKGLNPNVKMKDSGVEWIGEIPEHWDVAKLKNLLTLKTGTTPKAYEDRNDSDKLINWYTPSDILENGNIILSSERNIAKRVLDEENISLYPSGSLMFVGIGALAGKVGYALEAGYSNQQITALIPKKCNSKYYFYYLIADKNRIRDNAFFTTLPIINNGYLGQVIVLSPSIEEQQSIANYLDQKCKEIDELISIKKEKIEQLKAYKKSVIYEYVTGKKQVK